MTVQLAKYLFLLISVHKHTFILSFFSILLFSSLLFKKSAVALRFVRNQFVENGDPTVGACFFTKRVVESGVAVKIQLWDTAGQERFRALAPMYYHGAVAAVLIYDLTVPQSFDRVKSWAEELARNVTDEIVLAVVGAKLDLYEAMPTAQRPAHIPRAAKAYADELGAIYAETSAKEGKGIEPMFSELIRRVIAVKHLTPGGVTPVLPHPVGIHIQPAGPGADDGQGGTGCKC